MSLTQHCRPLKVCGPDLEDQSLCDVGTQQASVMEREGAISRANKIHCSERGKLSQP